ncbi:Werner syndrome ATP-dependent helicase homolog [Selaginella moellendorffii]|nr:Werner syndrome ATP-dependent helicase homolog [Selaginella moellendorffii]XP_024544077.1 Werner syndrome ATP-dependent helicase homolog [Selaginella moellendorffii]XP_024544079.1 Werner syndrome ATP-dependent helicase homolog [Selaginella moellendorffii]XP_024544080.1 Werner syndrome ATP-dependent helicase homolog [Selaginella moellendorffii]|eukprot:XP_002983197.2 Werner syndrome ATP-dependent helicase homolog [Selaginella moellendorffii]
MKRPQGGDGAISPRDEIEIVTSSKRRKVWDYVCKRQLLVHAKTRRTTVMVFGRKIDVVVTSDAAEIESWVLRQEGSVFGVDLEWKPNRVMGEENKVALIQICGETECLIVQMCYIDQIPDALVEFLKNSSSKAMFGGVGVKNDAEKLERDHGLVCKGTVELGVLATEKLGNQRLRNQGLKKMASIVIGLGMDKPKRVTMSNWENLHLSDAQVNYACVDAWVSYAILQKLLSS